MGLRREPNFFIVGAARAGTTSLWQWLRQHPDVFMPRDKEPHYFCDQNRPPWAISDIDSYLHLFAAARSETAVGEASTGYLSSPHSAQAIHDRYPHARIVIALREPVARIHSLYRLNCCLGVEWMPTFERALRIEDQRAASTRFARENPYFAGAYLYFRSGFVAEHIARFQQLFPAEQIHFVLFDDLTRDGEGTARALFRFLGVDPDVRVDVDAQNPSSFPYSVRAHHRLHKEWRRRYGRPFGNPQTATQKWFVVAWYLNLLLGSTFRAGGVDPGLRTELTAKYRDDILRTMSLSGRDLRGWLPSDARAKWSMEPEAGPQPAQS
jgi:hypothetical protein